MNAKVGSFKAKKISTRYVAADELESESILAKQAMPIKQEQQLVEEKKQILPTAKHSKPKKTFL